MGSEAIMNEQAIYRKILEQKRALSLKLFREANEEYFRDFREMNFSVPQKKDHLEQKMQRSTLSTAHSDELEAGYLPKQERTSQDEQKKAKVITNVLIEFEERCSLTRSIDHANLQILRSLNRTVLNRVLQYLGLFKHHQSLLIAVNILMFNSSKAGIPKESFKKLITEFLPKRKEVTVMSIKKSKSYSLLKNIVKSQL